MCLLLTKPPPSHRRTAATRGGAKPSRAGGASSLDSHGCRRETDASIPSPDLHEKLGLVHVPQGHPRGGPRLEVLGDGYRPALACLLPDTIELIPLRDVVAFRATGSARGAQDEIVVG